MGFSPTRTYPEITRKTFNKRTWKTVNQWMEIYGLPDDHYKRVLQIFREELPPRLRVLERCLAIGPRWVSPSNIRYYERFLERAIGEIGGALATRCFSSAYTPPLPPRALYHSIEYLLENVPGVAVTPTHVSWVSVAPTLDADDVSSPVEFPPYRITFEIGVPIGDVDRLFRLEPLGAIPRDQGTIHPHVSREGVPCLGGFQSLIESVVLRADLAALPDLMNDYLQTYDPDSAYLLLGYYGERSRSCVECGVCLDEDDGHESMYGDWVCGECMWSCGGCDARIHPNDCGSQGYCQKCGEPFCEGCREESLQVCGSCDSRLCNACGGEQIVCGGCDDWVCGDCVRSCEECNSSLCPSCYEIANSHECESPEGDTTRSPE